jgi:hypothetical protein
MEMPLELCEDTATSLTAIARNARKTWHEIALAWGRFSES